jgi:hypothetical protein
MFDRRAAIRLLAGFLIGLAVFFLFATTYERVVAPTAEFFLRLGESPAVTRIDAPGGDFEIKRADIPPGAKHPGVPAADIHFNFVLLGALFALHPRPWQGDRVVRFLIASFSLYLMHVVFLIFGIESLYATRFGEWSAAHYSAFARNFWAAGFHFYQIVGRFAAPFAIWWLFGRPDPAAPAEARRGPSRKKKRKT